MLRGRARDHQHAHGGGIGVGPFSTGRSALASHQSFRTVSFDRRGNGRCLHHAVSLEKNAKLHERRRPTENVLRRRRRLYHHQFGHQRGQFHGGKSCAGIRLCPDFLCLHGRWNRVHLRLDADLFRRMFGLFGKSGGQREKPPFVREASERGV